MDSIAAYATAFAFFVVAPSAKVDDLAGCARYSAMAASCAALFAAACSSNVLFVVVSVAASWRFFPCRLSFK